MNAKPHKNTRSLSASKHFPESRLQTPRITNILPRCIEGATCSSRSVLQVQSRLTQWRCQRHFVSPSNPPRVGEHATIRHQSASTRITVGGVKHCNLSWIQVQRCRMQPSLQNRNHFTPAYSSRAQRSTFDEVSILAFLGVPPTISPSSRRLSSPGCHERRKDEV